MSKTYSPRIIGGLILFIGIVFIIVSILAKVEDFGNYYFFLTGIGFVISGILLLLGKKYGVYSYGIVLFVMFVWSIIEVGPGIMMISRILLPLIIGILLFSKNIRSKFS
jgi:quinoprotein glucose dehydrogenase